jgi:16S rRNA (uracil1498-N3)-methyltransferase
VGHRGDQDVITLLAPAGSLRPGTELELPEGESHHLRVRRGRAGEPVRLMDGQGGVAEGAVTPAGRVTLGTVRMVAPPPPLVLAVGAGDKERWSWLVEKAAELGVTDLLPLETDRAAAVSTRLRPEHLDRLRRRALEAIKQSGAAWAPVIHPPATLADLLGRPVVGERWLADMAGGPPGSLGAGGAVTVAIGPEGGFTEAERQSLLGAGWLTVRLGPHVLRFETAAIAAALAAGALRPGGQLS